MNKLLTPEQFFNSPSFKKFAREVCELLSSDAEFKAAMAKKTAKGVTVANCKEQQFTLKAEMK